MNIGLSFNVGGQEIEVKPKIKHEKKHNKLYLNQIFEKINSFYKENNLTAFLIIDRLDNFVSKEEYTIQKNYIQGIIDTIEEIYYLSNIHPMLFLRTDLFYTFSIDLEYDKTKERTNQLEWTEGEILQFIVNRFMSNEYIEKNYGKHLEDCIRDSINEDDLKYIHEKPNWFESLRFWRKNKGRRSLDLKQDLNYRVAQKFLSTFLPKNFTIRIQGKSIVITDLNGWLQNYMKDANGFINPRLIIRFFNLLFEEQYSYYKENQINKKLNLSKENGRIHYPIFMEEVIQKVYEDIQKEEIRNIYKLLKNKCFQTMFKHLTLITSIKTSFQKEDVDITKLEKCNEQDLERMLKYLKLLGFCAMRKTDNYEVPNLFRNMLTNV